MIEKIKAATSTVTELVNATEVASIEQSNTNNMEKKEIPSQVIGEIVMERLKQLDQVAYVRFASVYREFKDVNTFMDELKKLLK